MTADFLIITPVINANYLIEQTIDSIIFQSGLGESFTVKYIIADSGSTNDTENTYVENLLAKLGNVKGLDIIHLKYRDESMYDGLVNAIETVKKDSFKYFSYINAGDYYSPYCLKTVYQNLGKNNKAWLTGCVGSYNPNGQLYKLIEPVAYPGSIIKTGLCGKVVPYIQQESTFFEYKLLDKINLSKLRKFKYAGDYYLWKSLADLGFDLTIIPVWLGGFREHEGQLSAVHKKEYGREVESIRNKRFFAAYIKSIIILLLSALHPRIRPIKLTAVVRAWK